jgi:hypothetical protein
MKYTTMKYYNQPVLRATILFFGVVVILLKTDIVFAQIGITSPETITKTTEFSSYDSTRNFVGNDIDAMIGQRLYLPPNYDSRSSIYLNYENFRLLPERAINYLRPNTSIYQFDDGSGHVFNPQGSRHDALANTYFYVKDVIRDGDDTFLQLIHEENEDIVYFIYPTRRSINAIGEYDFPTLSSWPFIVVGLIERIRTEYIGERIIVKDMHLRRLDSTTFQYKPRLNIETGQELSTYTGMTWKVIDVTIDASDNFALAFVAENEFGEKTTLSLNFAGKLCVGMFMGVYYEDQANEFISIYGMDKFESILKGEIQIGFTQMMVRLTMEPGYPIIDTRSTVISGHEFTVWEYGGGRFLYFDENGILSDKINW